MQDYIILYNGCKINCSLDLFTLPNKINHQNSGFTAILRNEADEIGR